MVFGDMVKHKLRVASYELKFESTSYEPESTSCEFESTSYEFESTSCELESTSYEFESTSLRITESLNH